MSKQIVIDIDEKTGEIKLETIGFKGKSCLESSQWVKDLIGKELSRELTPCYYMKEKDKIKKIRYLPLCGMWMIPIMFFLT